MKNVRKILLLEENPEEATTIRRHLEKENPDLDFRVAIEKQGFTDLLNEFRPDAVLTGNSLSQFDALDALHIVRKSQEHLPFILVTGTGSEEFAASVIHQGADDYVLKESLVRLPSAISTAVNRKKTEKEKKMALLELINSEEKYRNLVERISDAFIALDRNWCFTFLNRQAADLARREPKTLLGRNIWKEFPEAFGSDTYKAFHKAMEEQVFVTNVDYFEPLNLWHENDIYPSPDGLSIFIRDISEKKKAEEELKKSNERFLYATQASSDLIWELNFETREFLVHEGRDNFFGQQTLFAWQFGVDGEFIAPQDREKVKQSFFDARKDPTKELWELEYSMINNRNEMIRVINHAIFIRDNNGKAQRAVGALTDITERKKLELALLEQQKLDQLKLTAFVLDAREKERNAIGIELHDNVNQILVGTNMMLSMVRDDPSRIEEILPRCIRSIQEAIAENRKIAHELVTPNLATDSVLKLVSRLSETMLFPAGMVVHISTELFNEALLDSEQKLAVYRILQEQFTNIVKYSGAKKVIVTFSTNEKEFLLSICDNGQGMDSEQKVEGIGLNNIRSRVSVLGGDIAIHTAIGHGFRMEITLPLRS